jgi:hypothetical protein
MIISAGLSEQFGFFRQSPHSAITRFVALPRSATVCNLCASAVKIKYHKIKRQPKITDTVRGTKNRH